MQLLAMVGFAWATSYHSAERPTATADGDLKLLPVRVLVPTAAHAGYRTAWFRLVNDRDVAVTAKVSTIELLSAERCPGPHAPMGPMRARGLVVDGEPPRASVVVPPREKREFGVLFDAADPHPHAARVTIQVEEWLTTATTWVAQTSPTEADH